MTSFARRGKLALVPIVLAGSFVAAAASGCSTGGASAESIKAAGTVAAPAPVDPGYYAEAEHNGRIYVFGDPRTEQTFQTTHSIQIAKTFIGAGPGGRTVVFEARDKLAAMTARLIAKFSADHGVSLQ